MGTRGVIQKSFLILVAVIVLVAGLSSYVTEKTTGSAIRRVIDLSDDGNIGEGSTAVPALSPVQPKQSPRCSEPILLTPLPTGGVSPFYVYYAHETAMSIDNRYIAYLLGVDDDKLNTIYLIDMGSNRKLDRGEAPKPVYGAFQNSYVFGPHLHNGDLFWLETAPSIPNLRLQYCTNKPSSAPQCLTSSPQMIVSGTLGIFLDVSTKYLMWSVLNPFTNKYDISYCTRPDANCQKGNHLSFPLSQMLSLNEQLWQLEVTEKHLYISTGEYIPGNPDQWRRRIYVIDLATQGVSTLYDQTSPHIDLHSIHAVPVTGLIGVDDIVYLQINNKVDVQAVQNGKSVWGSRTLLNNVYMMSAPESPSQSFEFGYFGPDDQSKDYLLGVYAPTGSYTHPVTWSEWLEFKFNYIHYSNGNFVYVGKNNVPSYISCS